jgi:hypothetical protein
MLVQTQLASLFAFSPKSRTCAIHEHFTDTRKWSNFKGLPLFDLQKFFDMLPVIDAVPSKGNQVQTSNKKSKRMVAE